MGTYRRDLPVSLERMYENALDWEHLPHLHASSFVDLECLQAGAWGWRARTRDHSGRDSVIELRLDRLLRRWITRNLEGAQAGAEIWTHVFELEPRRLQINVDFFVPGVPAGARDKVGRAYASAYDTLYDEDVFMMSTRQQRLDARIDAVHPDAVMRVPVSTPDQRVTFDGRDFFVCAATQGAAADASATGWIAFPAVCPHQAGPLARPQDGRTRCPWHGYEFDIATGECLTGSKCRLGRAPLVTEVDGELELRWSGAEDVEDAS